MRQGEGRQRGRELLKKCNSSEAACRARAPADDRARSESLVDMTAADASPGKLIPLNILAAAERVDAALADAAYDSDDAYQERLRRGSTDLAMQAARQATLLGEIAAGERDRQMEHIRTIWCEVFDLFLSVVIVSKSATEWHVTEVTDRIRVRGEAEDPRMSPLVNLHARMIRTALEVHTLSIEGLPRGALARARSMYELAITSRIIGEHGAPDGSCPELAERYSRSQDIERCADAEKYNELCPTDDRLSDADMNRWRAERDEATRDFGPDITKMRGWVRPLFPNKKGPISIPDLEELAGFGGSRLFYRWANHEVHATSRGGALNTYVDDNGRYVHSTGRSHRGLGEPISMAATYVLQSLVDVLMDTESEHTTVKSLTVATVQALVERTNIAMLDASSVANQTPYLT